MQRALPLTEEWATRVDDGAVAFWNALLGVTETPRAQLFMKGSEGGFGFGSAVARGPAALLASWEAGIRAAATELQETTAVGLWRRWPGLGRALSAADAAQGRLAGGRAPQADRWQGLLEGRAGTGQKTYLHRTSARARHQGLLGQPAHRASGGSAPCFRQLGVRLVG